MPPFTDPTWTSIHARSSKSSTCERCSKVRDRPHRASHVLFQSSIGLAGAGKRCRKLHLRLLPIPRCGGRHKLSITFVSLSWLIPRPASCLENRALQMSFGHIERLKNMRLRSHSLSNYKGLQVDFRSSLHGCSESPRKTRARENTSPVEPISTKNQGLLSPKGTRYCHLQRLNGHQKPLLQVVYHFTSLISSHF